MIHGDKTSQTLETEWLMIRSYRCAKSFHKFPFMCSVFNYWDQEFIVTFMSVDSLDNLHERYLSYFWEIKLNRRHTIGTKSSTIMTRNSLREGLITATKTRLYSMTMNSRPCIKHLEYLTEERKNFNTVQTPYQESKQNARRAFRWIWFIVSSAGRISQNQENHNKTTLRAR